MKLIAALLATFLPAQAAPDLDIGRFIDAARTAGISLAQARTDHEQANAQHRRATRRAQIAEEAANRAKHQRNRARAKASQAQEAHEELVREHGRAIREAAADAAAEDLETADHEHPTNTKG